MKKLFVAFVVFVSCSTIARSAPLEAEAPILAVGAGSTVSISTSVWTVVPTSVDLSRRAGVKISNPSSNNANVVCILDTTDPAEATTIRPIEIQPGENPFIPVRYDILVYCLSLHTSAESIHAQEVGQ